MVGRASPGHISESEYSSLLHALSASTKGRSFLSEYSSRLRPEEDRTLLDSLLRIESTIAALRAELLPDRLADELLRICMTLEIATDGAAADSEGDESARRFALIQQARTDLLSLARSLSPAPTAPPNAVDGPAIELIDDEAVFFDQLSLSDSGAPEER